MKKHTESICFAIIQAPSAHIKQTVLEFFLHIDMEQVTRFSFWNIDI